MTRSLFRLPYAVAWIAVTAVLAGTAYFAGQYFETAGSRVAEPTARAADRLDTLDGDKPAKDLWVCPMHAQILQDHPGSCPLCGMDLVGVEGTHDHGDAGVEVDTASQQRLGVRLASARSQMLSRQILTYGTVAIDEASLLDVSPKIEGWIRKLHVTAVGQQVRAGQVLYEIYSPELVQRQREYVELLQRRDRLLQSMTELSGQNAQMAASLARERFRMREKFAHADVSNAILDQIEKTHRTVDLVPVHAPASGYVTRIGAREGAYVTPMVNLLSLANTARVWIDVALYPDQLDWIENGDAATVTLPGSQTAIKGRLVFASPELDRTTQTVRARVVVDNARQRLRPGRFVDIAVAAQPHEALAIPRSAVMRTGRGARVMLAPGDGRFVPVAVETGLESGELVEITAGLDEGAQVAVNGQFLLDAAASLSDAAQRMQGDR